MARTFLKVAALVALASICQAVPTFDAKAYMDGILEEMSVQARRQDLDPVPAHNFQVHLEATGTKPHVVARFHEGSFEGLGSISTAGRCNFARVNTEGTKMQRVWCYVSLANIKLTMRAFVEEIMGRELGTITAETQTGPEVLGLIEIEKLNGKVSVRVIDPPDFDLTTKIVQGELPVDSHRYADFERQVDQEVSEQLSHFLKNAYTRLLTTVVERSDSS
ncbi:uncharacterized protein LOC100906538 [Galendromus occidentalis]|uniref:Uncharacterized protein LOC100906538 n=1 Tax=Galendromus occidentalis TaxID=34638 RepID=A0AAJ6QPB7_9ACAR|nr:uncharacterized protein LOC100906538 [Galendromus occidentalis]